MMKKPFLDLGKPQMEYAKLPGRLGQPEPIPTPGSVTLLHRRPAERKAIPSWKVGDPVKTGQKIELYEETAGYVTSPATGRIASLSPFAGDFGRSYTAVTITVDPPEAIDDQFEAVHQEPTLATARTFLAAAPGLPPLQQLGSEERPVKTLIISGMDDDLLVLTQQYVLRTRFSDVERGIHVLKEMTGIEDVVILTSRESVQGYGHIGGRVMGVNSLYPSARPPLVMYNVFGQELPAGRACEDLGFCFLNAEAAAALGTAFETGRIPVTKILTFISKDGVKRLVEAAIGTPIGDILKRFNVPFEEGDRIVRGGPMRGAAIYTLDHPVQPDTDAIMVLDAAQAAHISQYPCINCGECVRACPARIQVNLLIRYLEAGKYEDAEEGYDLHSCVECGLCSYVCVSKIPILQYITLAKYELARSRQTEGANA